MMEQIRATGASVMLHGIGPTMWKDRRDPIPVPLPIASLLIPSETDIDFSNLEWFAVFREWTPTQLYQMTHGPKVDPGWNMRVVMNQLKYVAQETRKQPNSVAYQYMPERIEELIKQDGGYWGSDAVPTVDVWDCYFREAEDGKGWYRRIFLDWELGKDEIASYANSRGIPTRNKETDGFIYTSGKRCFSNYLCEIMHCNFGDCSPVAPFKYHSVRSLGWMIWGVVDIMNRLQCRFTESVFEQLLWFFRVASQGDFDRIKKAMFTHMGVIPNGVSFVTANERFKPDTAIISSAFSMMNQMLAENAASYVQDFEGGNTGKEQTATEVMARVNNVNTLVSGMLNLAYTYQTSQYREIARRFCIKNSPYVAVREFRKRCLADGVPQEMFDVERWDIEPERTLGGGNKTLEIAQANQLLQMRQFLGPDAQRRVDHIAVEVFTDDPALAEDLAPVDANKPISKSQHDAQQATGRLMLGLPFDPMPSMVYEDYVQVWLKDMASRIQILQQIGNPSMQDVVGLGNIGAHVQRFLELMAQSDEDKPKIKSYMDMLTQLSNVLRGFAQQAQEAMQAQAGGEGNGGPDPAAISKIVSSKIVAEAKAQNMRESHSERTAQRQVQFEMEQQRKDRELAANIRRDDVLTAQELAQSQAFTQQDLTAEALKNAQSIAQKKPQNENPNP